MSSPPIGIFDSGVGGLSVLRALRARLHSERFVYVADSACAPYGDRPEAYVRERAQTVARFLARRGCKAIVIACNTASVLVAEHLRSAHALPIVAMEPAIKPAALSTRSKVVLVLATTGTLRSPAVARLCAAHGAGIRILLQPCPGLADQVERGDLRSAATRQLLRDYLLPGLAEGADTIVLGCTHYAFLTAEMAALAGPSVGIVEPSEAIARQLARVLGSAGPASVPGTGGVEFHTSGSTGHLASFLAAVGEPAGPVFALIGDNT